MAVFLGGIGSTDNKLKEKVIDSFISEFGYKPKNVKIEGDYAYADGYYCRIIKNKTIKKIYGRAWRLDD